MPKFSTESKYLKYTDLPDDQDSIVTIKAYAREELENKGKTQEKWVLTFAELKKPLALNATNGKAVCKALGTEEIADWVGQKIALYVKDDIEYEGDVVSGIRVRPKKVT